MDVRIIKRKQAVNESYGIIVGATRSGQVVELSRSLKEMVIRAN